MITATAAHVHRQLRRAVFTCRAGTYPTKVPTCTLLQQSQYYTPTATSTSTPTERIAWVCIYSELAQNTYDKLTRFTKPPSTDLSYRCCRALLAALSSIMHYSYILLNQTVSSTSQLVGLGSRHKSLRTHATAGVHVIIRSSSLEKLLQLT